ncbi:hypothetical protein MTHERMOG20_12750 [Moorella thermoacetica]|nr:hypothetical protein MTHERMOG20_12750 [Moorella thermoacetica]
MLNHCQEGFYRCRTKVSPGNLDVIVPGPSPDRLEDTHQGKLLPAKNPDHYRRPPFTFLSPGDNVPSTLLVQYPGQVMGHADIIGAEVKGVLQESRHFNPSPTSFKEKTGPGQPVFYGI